MNKQKKKKSAGQYLHWAKGRPTAQCWWCQCPSQTRNHLFKVCPEWKMQQKVLWAEVQKETGREEPVEDPGPTCRREVWAGGTILPLGYRCGEASPTSGREQRRKRGVRVGTPGAAESERRAGVRGAGCHGRGGLWGGTSAVPSPRVHGIGRRGLGDGVRLSFVLCFPL